MCECSTRMEQPCPGALTHKEELLLLLLSRSEMGKREKRISRGTAPQRSSNNSDTEE